MNTQEIKTMISTQIDYYEKEIKKQKSELGIADAGLKGALHGVKLVLGNIEMMEEQKNPPFDYSYKTLSRWVRAQNYTEAQIQDIYEYGSDLTPRGYKLPWAKYSIELYRILITHVTPPPKIKSLLLWR